MKFLSRDPTYCAICNKELKHKHKPKKEWNIDGYLCAECHMDKMRDFYEGTMTQNCVQCSVKKKMANTATALVKKFFYGLACIEHSILFCKFFDLLVFLICKTNWH